MLGEGPTTYSMADLRDAMNMATKMVSSYGLSDAGLTLYTPNTSARSFMKQSFEVSYRSFVLLMLQWLADCMSWKVATKATASLLTPAPNAPV